MAFSTVVLVMFAQSVKALPLLILLQVFECPFFVADIEDKKEVVIAIRGTFSLQVHH